MIQMITYPNLHSNLTFSKYLSECRTIIEGRRVDLDRGDNINRRIVDANSPYELLPLATHSSKQSRYGALLIHGLFDSPFSLKELSHHLQQNGILSRAILLPGHGTVPSDLLHVSYLDWINAVRYGVETLEQEVDKIFLVGYSTGAALSIYQALHNNRIAGIILLAPAIKIRSYLDIVLGWHLFKKLTRINRDWAYLEKEDDYTKYHSIAFNPVFQVSKLIEVIETLQQQRTLSCPIFMATSREDETVCSDTAIDFFSHFHHHNSQLLLYTSSPHRYPDSRIILRPTDYPGKNINHVSHIAIPFSPQNSHYGQNGDYTFASRPDPKFVYGAYNQMEEKTYDLLHKWGLVKRQRRALTYNPDFDYLAEKILNFIR